MYSLQTMQIKVSRAVQSQEVAVYWEEPMVRERNAAATTHTLPQSTTPGLHPISIHQMTPPA